MVLCAQQSKNLERYLLHKSNYIISSLLDSSDLIKQSWCNGYLSGLSHSRPGFKSRSDLYSFNFQISFLIEDRLIGDRLSLCQTQKGKSLRVDQHSEMPTTKYPLPVRH